MIKTKVVQNVNRMSEIFFSLCQYVNLSICQYVSMSICQNATFQLRYQNKSCSECHKDLQTDPALGSQQWISPQIRMSDSQKILVRKFLRTAKEPALVYLIKWFAYNAHRVAYNTYFSMEDVRDFRTTRASCIRECEVNVKYFSSQRHFSENDVLSLRNIEREITVKKSTMLYRRLSLHFTISQSVIQQ